jgi:hypothetical protein
MGAITIPRRLCGPPDSGNGGYTCGVTAAALKGGPVEVTLTAPPPLERQLAIEHEGGEARLVDGDQVIAIARRADAGADVPAGSPEPLSFDDAAAAAAIFDVDEYRRTHEYPTCFTCGPDRTPGDGLRIFAAPTNRPDRVVWPWTPDPLLFDGRADLEAPLVWAALDCPSGLAAMAQEPDTAMVLGRMAAVIHRSPRPEEPLVVSGWTEAADGRRRPARSAIHTTEGEVVAASRSTWIVLTDAQRAAFRGARP